MRYTKKMTSLLSRLLLSLLIISSMTVQTVVSAFDVHFDTPTTSHTHDNAHHIDMLKHKGTLASHTHDNHPAEAIDLVDHCCHSLSTSAAIAADTSSLHLPKLAINTPLYISNLYQNPSFDSLIRPPIA